MHNNRIANEYSRYLISDDQKRLVAGENETVFHILESRFCVMIQSRIPGELRIYPRNAEDSGNEPDIDLKNDSAVSSVFGTKTPDVRGVLRALDQLLLATQNGLPIETDWILRYLEKQDVSFKELSEGQRASHNTSDFVAPVPILRNRYGQPVFAKTISQETFIKASSKNDILFANGPAGTGKTFLAVALAVKALETHEAERIFLVRPAVEAGESLGFLPGDLKEKIAPYLRPIHDSLSELLPADKLARYKEAGIIEVAPLAYMRGRTLKRAFIILDEAQNATIPQMKMFLTRIGLHSKAIITGDTTQVDLNKKEPSGFLHAMQLLKGIQGIARVDFQSEDVLRHRLVKNIIEAYEHCEKEKPTIAGKSTSKSQEMPL